MKILLPVFMCLFLSSCDSADTNISIENLPPCGFNEMTGRLGDSLDDWQLAKIQVSRARDTVLATIVCKMPQTDSLPYVRVLYKRQVVDF